MPTKRTSSKATKKTAVKHAAKKVSFGQKIKTFMHDKKNLPWMLGGAFVVVLAILSLGFPSLFSNVSDGLYGNVMKASEGVHEKDGGYGYGYGFSISVIDQVIQGEEEDVTIKVYNDDGSIDQSYVGDVFIELEGDIDDDDEYEVPHDGLYTFVEEDHGQKTFEDGLQIEKSGTYRLKVTDILDTERYAVSGPINVYVPNSCEDPMVQLSCALNLDDCPEECMIAYCSTPEIQLACVLELDDCPEGCMENIGYQKTQGECGGSNLEYLLEGMCFSVGQWNDKVEDICEGDLGGGHSFIDMCYINSSSYNGTGSINVESLDLGTDDLLLGEQTIYKAEITPGCENYEYAKINEIEAIVNVQNSDMNIDLDDYQLYIDGELEQDVDIDSMMVSEDISLDIEFDDGLEIDACGSKEIEIKANVESNEGNIDTFISDVDWRVYDENDNKLDYYLISVGLPTDSLPLEGGDNGGDTCTDTDGGTDYYTKGTTHNPPPNYNGSWTDRCISSETLQEGSCIEGSGIHTYQCPHGCNEGNGVCIEVEVPSYDIDMGLSTTTPDLYQWIDMKFQVVDQDGNVASDYNKPVSISVLYKRGGDWYEIPTREFGDNPYMKINKEFVDAIITSYQGAFKVQDFISFKTLGEYTVELKGIFDDFRVKEHVVVKGEQRPLPLPEKKLEVREVIPVEKASAPVKKEAVDKEKGESSLADMLRSLTERK